MEINISEEEALKYISTYAAYNPINMEKEQGYKKKQEFTIDILDNDLLRIVKLKNKKYTFWDIWQIS